MVESVSPDVATLRVIRTKPGGQRLGAEKGINLPDTVLPLAALTPEDDSHLPFVARHADLVAISFVRTADDVQYVLDRLETAGAGDLGLLLKIETRQGFENLPSILLMAMRHPKLGVMIAEGTLLSRSGSNGSPRCPGRSSPCARPLTSLRSVVRRTSLALPMTVKPPSERLRTC